MNVLKSKVAIVTGAGQGIGRGLALALAKAGASVVVTDVNPDTSAAVAKEIQDQGLKATSAVCDVSSESQVQQMVDHGVKKFGPIDILINNAQAVYTEYSPIEEMTEQRFDRTYNTGIRATWYACRAVFPHMKERGGKIINMGSAWGVHGAPGWSDYAGNKEAIRAFSRSAAREWGKYGINVNVICPSLASPAGQDLLKKQEANASDNSVTKDTIARIKSGVNALGRKGDPEKDGGPVAVFLSSSASDYLTGGTYYVDGGGLIAP